MKFSSLSEVWQVGGRTKSVEVVVHGWQIRILLLVIFGQLSRGTIIVSTSGIEFFYTSFNKVMKDLK